MQSFYGTTQVTRVKPLTALMGTMPFSPAARPAPQRPELDGGRKCPESDAFSDEMNAK